MSKPGAKTPEIDKNLESLARYVALNTPVHASTTPEPTKRGGEDVKVTAVKMIGNMVIDQYDIVEKRGSDYSYHCSTGIQGLSAFSGAPLYASMTPDSYYLPNGPMALDDNTISALVSNGIRLRRLQAIREAMQEKGQGNFTKELNEKEFANIPPEIIEEVDRKFNPSIDEITRELTEALRSKAYSESDPDQLMEIEKILTGGKFELMPILSKRMTQPLRNFIANQYAQKVADTIGADVNGTKQYAVLSIGGPDRSEANAYGIAEQFRTDQNKQEVIYHNLPSQPTAALYQGHNQSLNQQLVIQSKGENKGEKYRELNFAASDLEMMVSFYENTMKKNIPVVVNCTDGIDRTGMMVVALMMLHNAKELSNKTESEQKEFLTNMIDKLKQERGPSFLKRVHDAATAVTIGFSLIATQKQMEFQRNLKNNESIHQDLRNLATNAESIAPDKLKIEINKIKEMLTKKEDQELADSWVTLIDDRIKKFSTFAEVDRPTGTDTYKAINKTTPLMKGTNHYKTDPKPTKDTFLIADAPIAEYIKLMKNNINLGAYKDKQGLTIYHYATQTMIKDINVENIKQMSELLKMGGETAQKAFSQSIEQLSANDKKNILKLIKTLSPNTLGEEAKPFLTQFKSELSKPTAEVNATQKKKTSIRKSIRKRLANAGAAMSNIRMPKFKSSSKKKKQPAEQTKAPVQPETPPIFGQSNNPGGLIVTCDFDDTLAKSTKAGTAYNNNLINAWKDQGITEIYLCTGMTLGEAGDLTIASRAEAIKYIESQGIKVKGVLTSLDPILYCGQQRLKNGTFPTLEELLKPFPQFSTDNKNLQAAYDKFKTIMSKDSVMGKYYQEIISPMYDRDRSTLGNDPEYNALTELTQALAQYVYQDKVALKQPNNIDDNAAGDKILAQSLAIEESTALGFPIKRIVNFDDDDRVSNNASKAARNDAIVEGIQIGMVKKSSYPNARITETQITNAIEASYEKLGLSSVTQARAKEFADNPKPLVSKKLDALSKMQTGEIKVALLQAMAKIQEPTTTNDEIPEILKALRNKDMIPEIKEALLDLSKRLPIPLKDAAFDSLMGLVQNPEIQSKEAKTLLQYAMSAIRNPMADREARLNELNNLVKMDLHPLINSTIGEVIKKYDPSWEEPLFTKTQIAEFDNFFDELAADINNELKEVSSIQKPLPCSSCMQHAKLFAEEQKHDDLARVVEFAVFHTENTHGQKSWQLHAHEIVELDFLIKQALKQDPNNTKLLEQQARFNAHLVNDQMRELINKADTQKVKAEIKDIKKPLSLVPYHQAVKSMDAMKERAKAKEPIPLVPETPEVQSDKQRNISAKK